jgi:hypothetical protein
MFLKACRPWRAVTTAPALRAGLVTMKRSGGPRHFRTDLLMLFVLPLLPVLVLAVVLLAVVLLVGFALVLAFVVVLLAVVAAAPLPLGADACVPVHTASWPSTVPAMIASWPT